MNAKKRNQLEKNLLQTLVLFRYEEEISLIEMEAGDLNAKKAKDTGAFKKAFDGIVDKFRKPKEHNEDDLAKAKQNRDAYALTLSEEVDPSLAIDETRLSDAVNAFFDKDQGSERLALGLEACLMETDPSLPELLRPEASRKALSRVLFADEEMLGKMLEVYLYSILKISGKKAKPEPEAKQDLGVKLGAAGVGILATSLLTGPVGLLLGTAVSLSGLALYQYGKKQGQKAERSEELLLFSSFIYSHDIAKKRYGRRAAKRLRALGQEVSSAGYVLALASAITLYNFRYLDKTTDLAKLACDGLLKRIDSLRQDAEYLALVERVDMVENRKKMVAAERAVTLLYELIYKDASREEVEIEIVEVPSVA